jgi:transcriptional regulator with XRE-family HTH domain
MRRPSLTLGRLFNQRIVDLLFEKPPSQSLPPFCNCESLAKMALAERECPHFGDRGQATLRRNKGVGAWLDQEPRGTGDVGLEDDEDISGNHPTDASHYVGDRRPRERNHSRKTGAAMKTLGQFLIERRKAQGLSQKEFAALIKNRDGKPISATYLNYLEHDRGKPPDYLLDQFADVLKVERDMLYFWAQRMPPDVWPDEANEEQVTAAYRAFRRELKSKGGGKGGKRS